MRVLVTGSRGFVGSHVRDALQARHEVVAPSSVELDVTDAAAVDRILSGSRFDVVVHAAVRGGSRVAEDTIRGLWNLSRNEHRVARVVYFGSGAEFAKTRHLRKVREEEVGNVVPEDSYGFAKLVGHDIARRSHRMLNLRLFGVYGPREDYLQKFISNAIAKTLCGLALVVHQDVVFDYLWVGDLARVVEALLEATVPWTDVNVTPTESISLSNIVELIRRVSGREVPAIWLTGGMNFEYTGDNSRLRECVPGLEFTPYETGVEALWYFLEARESSLDRETLARDDFLERSRTR